MSCAGEQEGGWILRSMVERLRTPIIDRIEWKRNERERIRRIRVIALLANGTSTPFYVFVPVLNQPYKHTHSFLLFLPLLFHSLFFLFWGIFVWYPRNEVDLRANGLQWDCRSTNRAQTNKKMAQQRQAVWSSRMELNIYRGALFANS